MASSLDLWGVRASLVGFNHNIMGPFFFFFFNVAERGSFQLQGCRRAC